MKFWRRSPSAGSGHHIASQDGGGGGRRTRLGISYGYTEMHLIFTNNNLSENSFAVRCGEMQLFEEDSANNLQIVWSSAGKTKRSIDYSKIVP